MVGYAVTQGRVYMKSDGSPWRPLVHVYDIAQAFRAIIEAPRAVIHDEVFNVGSTDENYQIRQVADIVEEAVPGARFEMSGTAGPDIRDYRVNCDKIHEALPQLATKWTVEAGAQELADSFEREGLDEELFFGPLMRIGHIRRQQEAGILDDDLRIRIDEHAKARA
jgi:nucleoside-diphosphate-sugar epimerase